MCLWLTGLNGSGVLAGFQKCKKGPIVPTDKSFGDEGGQGHYQRLKQLQLLGKLQHKLQKL